MWKRRNGSRNNKIHMEEVKEVSSVVEYFSFPTQVHITNIWISCWVSYLCNQSRTMEYLGSSVLLSSICIHIKARGKVTLLCWYRSCQHAHFCSVCASFPPLSYMNLMYFKAELELTLDALSSLLCKLEESLSFLPAGIEACFLPLS